jgi:hypothetical protein
VENDLPRKWSPKAGRNSYTHIKISKKRQGYFILIKTTNTQEETTI